MILKIIALGPTTHQGWCVQSELLPPFLPSRKWRELGSGLKYCTCSATRHSFCKWTIGSFYWNLAYGDGSSLKRPLKAAPKTKPTQHGILRSTWSTCPRSTCHRHQTKRANATNATSDNKQRTKEAAVVLCAAPSKHLVELHSPYKPTRNVGVS